MTKKEIMSFFTAPEDVYINPLVDGLDILLQRMQEMTRLQDEINRLLIESLKKMKEVNE